MKLCNGKALNLPEKLADGRFGCRRDANEGVHGDVLHAALNFTDVFGIQIGLFGKFFLSQLRASAVTANRLGKQFSVSQDFMGHNPKE